MTLRSGLGGQWAVIDEATYGVVPSLAAALFYAADNDSLKLKKTPKQGAGIFAGSLAPRASRRVITEYSAAGALPMDLPQRQMNTWLYRMFGSYGQTPAALTEDASTSAYSATHNLGPIEGHSFALQKGAPTVDGTTVPISYSGCKVSEWEISATMGEIAKLTLTIEARNEIAGSWKDPLNASVPALQAFVPPPGGVFTWVGGKVLYGGTPTTTAGVTTLTSPTVAGNIKGPISVKCTRPLDLTRYAIDVAPFRNEPVQNALSQPSGSFGVEWLSAQTYYAAYQADTATSIELQFIGPAIGTGADFSTLSILCSNIRLDGDSPSIAGPAVLEQVVPWSVFDDATNNVIQATYWTLDTV